MGNIAKAICRQGRVEEAMKLQQNVYAKFVDGFGENDLYTLMGAQNLAWMYHENGNNNAAEEMYQDALGRFSQNSLEGHGFHWRALNGFANLLSELYRLDEAAGILRRVIDHRTKLHGTTHPKVISANIGLAQVRWRENLIMDAISIVQNAIAGIGICYGMTHARKSKASKLAGHLTLQEPF